MRALDWVLGHRKTKWAIAIWLTVELLALIALFFEAKYLT